MDNKFFGQSIDSMIDLMRPKQNLEHTNLN